MEHFICPICNMNSHTSCNDGLYIVNCDRCGPFNITEELVDDLTDDPKLSKIKYKISSFLKERYIRKKERITLFLNEPSNEVEFPVVVTLNSIIQQYPINLSDKIDKALLNLVNISKYPGEKIKIIKEDSSMFYPETNNSIEVFFIIDSLIKQGFVTGHAGFPTDLTVTVEGWNRSFELEKDKYSESKQGFIAMWFDKEMDGIAKKGFEQAIIDAGFNPLRIDRKEHNNKIDDEIIAEIKKSKFVVADFSGHRGGVYFEAGFAMGLGKQVIWTCRDDYLDSIHFDTRQFSHIVWENEYDLYKKLYNRIRATIN